MNKCDSYRIELTTKYTFHPITGAPIAHKVQKSVCWGTKAIDECSCGGDRTKCDFYPEVREKALKDQEPKFGEWISAKDRLPESNGWYMCYIQNRVTTMVYNSAISHPNDVWHCLVTHWMPFPKPPKGE